MNTDSVNAMKTLCVTANEQLSKKNHEGILEAQQTFSEIQEIAKKSPQKNVRRFARSALYNIGKAREYFEKAESDYTRKFRVVCTWKHEREQLDNHLRGLYKDWKNLQQELEGSTIDVEEVRSSPKNESLIEKMSFLRDLYAYHYGGFEGTIELVKDARDRQDRQHGEKLTSYEQHLRDKRFSLAGKLASSFAHFSTLVVGAGFGFYRGLEGMSYAGNGETLGGIDIAELTVLGASSLGGYADALLERPHPHTSLVERLGEATLGLSISTVIGHSLGYAIGAGTRGLLR